MIIRRLICKHCGTEYQHQFSGSYDALDTPKEYRSDEYCPECQKAIYEALQLILIKFKNHFVPTTEVTLDRLKKWEIDREKQFEIDNVNNNLLPLSRRVFAGLSNFETGARTITKEVKGRDEMKDRTYIYHYWSDKPEDFEITVEKRIEIATGKEICYVLNK